jgi:SPP1 gp7 family putative phage head morphogenesis protein
MASPAPTQAPISDAAARHQVYLNRYANGLIARILDLLRKSDDRASVEIQRRLDRLTQGDLFELTHPNWTTRRLLALRDEIRAMAQASRDILAGRLVTELGDLAVYESEFQQRMIAGAVKVDLDFVTPSRHTVVSAAIARPFQGRHMRDWIDGVVGSQSRHVLQTLREGYLLGETTPEIISRLRTEGLQRTYREVELVTRTATNHFASVAREKLYEENASLIKAVVWVSTLDGRTSAICQARDGIEYPVSKGPRPPAHPNCRSTTAPVMRTWAELGVDDFPEAGVGERPVVADTRTRAPAADRPGA